MDRQNVIRAADPLPENRERQVRGIYTAGVIGILVVVTMTFAALILVFINRSQVSFNWMHIILPPILWFDTLILAASSFTFEIGHRKLCANDQPRFYRWTLRTALFGVAFLAGQIFAWWQILEAGQLVDRNPHSFFFFLFSGLHGLHILAGLAGLAVLLYRTREPASGPRWQMTTKALAGAVAIFWHYLDALWVTLFALLLFVKS
jgi:cytochrome c oxidase subunit III